MRRKTYFAYVDYQTSSRPNDIYKIIALSEEDAALAAKSYISAAGGCRSFELFTDREFKQRHPERYKQLLGAEPRR